MAFSFFKKSDKTPPKEKEENHSGPRYYDLTVKNVIQETNDAVSVAFVQPEPKISYKAGQFLTLIVPMQGKDVRRAYSLCSSPFTDTDLVVTVNEALQATPYLSLVPQGGSPIPVELSKTSETTYAGSVLIDANTPSGVANALFSARDLVGNRGTDIAAGATLRIDTEGPALTGIVLSPSAPIKSDTNSTLTARFSFSKPPKPGSVPALSYGLSGAGRTAVVLGGLTQIDASTWQASFTLPADAGQAAPETLSFGSQASDDLDNVSNRVTAVNRFQVYQGGLPPLNIPFGFSAQAQPAGKVRLQWQAVADASAYQIYRQGPGDNELIALVRASGESAATLAVRMAPFLRKVRRVTGELVGELDWVFMVMVIRGPSCTDPPPPQAKVRCQPLRTLSTRKRSPI